MKIVVRGVRSQSGFGVATIGLLRLLDKAGHDLRFIPLTQDHGQDSIGIEDEEMKFIKSITIKQNDEFIVGSTFIEVGALGYGASCQKLDGVDRYILYTTTETTNINQGYAEAFNSKFDEVWTASKFNSAGLLQAGVEKPIKILPHLIDTDKFNPDLKPYKIKNKRGFNFIVNIDFSYRKGLHLLLPAYMDAFSREDDVSLILKISDNNFKDPTRPINALNGLLHKYSFNTKKHAPILVIPTMIQGQYLPNLYTTGDVYLAPTLGEGFGLPIAESMACGVPPIVTQASAPSEYVSSDTGFLIDLDEANPVLPIQDPTLLQRDPNYRGRFLYNPSQDSLSTQLKSAFETDRTELKNIGQAARESIINKFSFDPLLKTLNELLEG